MKTNIALTVKTILKYRNHLNAIFITRFWNQASSFNLSFIDKNTVLKAIACLSTTKASQDFDLLVKILKENADYFVEIISTEFNDSQLTDDFHNFHLLLNTVMMLIFKNDSRNQPAFTCSKLTIETLEQGVK